MTKKTSLEIVAETAFAFSDGTRSVKLQLYRPVERARDQWVCAHRLIGGDDDAVIDAFGIDSFQALYLGLVMVQTRLRFIERQHGVTLQGVNGSDIGISIGPLRVGKP